MVALAGLGPALLLLVPLLTVLTLLARIRLAAAVVAGRIRVVLRVLLGLPVVLLAVPLAGPELLLGQTLVGAAAVVARLRLLVGLVGLVVPGS